MKSFCNRETFDESVDAVNWLLTKLKEIDSMFIELCLLQGYDPDEVKTVITTRVNVAHETVKNKMKEL